MNSENSTPSYARCSIGRGRWFWVTWKDFAGICEGEFHSSGVASTAAEAERQARESVKGAVGCDSLPQEPTAFARQVHRKLAVMKRASRQSEGTGAAQLEFVYHDYDSDDGSGMWSLEYRIVKKTKTKVYVEDQCRSWSWEENGTTYHDVSTFVLDRLELESTGRAYSRRRGDFFYTTPYEKRRMKVLPQPFTVLGLNAPCTREDIHRAYRKRAQKAHPDHGGDGERFKQLHAAFEEALRIVDRREGGGA